MDWLFSHLPKLFDGVTAVGIVAGLFALTKLAVEYSRDNRRKRMELYLALREYFRTNERFGEIFEFLDGNISTDVFESEVNADTRAEFASFLEDVAMCVSSGELKPDVAHYMFGYYVIRCWENEVFWNGLEQDSIYWALLKGFYEEMKNQRKILEVAHPNIFGRLKWFGRPIAS